MSVEIGLLESDPGYGGAGRVPLSLSIADVRVIQLSDSNGSVAPVRVTAERTSGFRQEQMVEI